MKILNRLFIIHRTQGKKGEEEITPILQKDSLGRKKGCAIIFHSKLKKVVRVNSFKRSCQRFLRGILDKIVRYWAHGSLERRAEKITQLFENQIPAQSRILDLGGGWGFYSGPLQKRGHQHLILDVVNSGYQKAPVVLYDGTRIPFPDQSFEVTILVTVLHHVADPSALFKEVKRVTRGKVIVVEDLYHHSLGRFWTIIRDRILNFEWLDHPHQFRKHEVWVQFFLEQGFRVLHFEKFYTWLAGFRILNGIYVLEKAESASLVKTFQTC